MKNSILQEFNKKDAQAFLDTQDYLQGFVFPLFFPWKPSPTLKYETLIGQTGVAVAGDIVSYNSSAPIKSRKVLGKLAGNIPSVRIMRTMTEDDMNDYIQFRALATSDAHKALLKLIYDDVSFCASGCLARLEWLVLQALSSGSVSLTNTNNAGIVTEHAIDFQIPASHKRVIKTATATRTWDNSTATNPLPLTDIKVVCDLARDNGTRIQYIIMNQTTFAAMIATSQVVNMCAPYMGFGYLGTTSFAPTPTLAAVNAYLTAQSLPQIRVIDQRVTLENRDFTQTTVDPWTDYNVLFLPDLACGNMLYAPIAEEVFTPKQADQMKKDNVLVTKFSTVNPTTENTKGEINAFPSWSTVSYCYLLNTDATPQADGLDD